MNFLFKTKTKSPAELVKIARENITKLEGGDNKKNKEEVAKSLASMKQILYGDGESDPSPELVAQLSQEIYNNDILTLLSQNIARLDFETRKDVSQVFNNLLRRKIGSRLPTVEYLATRENIIFTLLKGLVYINFGDCVKLRNRTERISFRHEPLAKIVLYSPQFFDFFRYVETGTFDIASDAFASFREILTRHKPLVSQFLETNYSKFFEEYQKLLTSPNYVTKRQSLKLLNEILLERSNFTIMTRYISVGDTLKLMMNLLRDKSRNIQFEAFHVFKVFVANPNKSQPVLDILTKNKDKLEAFLTNFHNDRNDDQQFHDEKAFLLKQIQKL
ncbi:Hym1p [Entomophthora muscae]|uniref:Hym1p n=1 Tax=Entomophthora muscae TaxID=34485 RepID=A0ACC2T9W7_9FUNG|nr:Hym1p [Entomophthora muscae]